MMSYQPKILALAGSTREESFNKKLVKIAVAGATDAGGKITYIDLRDFPLPLFDQDLEAREGLPENAIKIKELMWSHDSLLISSPEYNSSISGVLKNTIDWASRNHLSEEKPLSCFKGKIATLMSASIGVWGGLRGLVHLRWILNNLGVVVLPEQQTVSFAQDAFSSKGLLKDPKKQKSIEKLGENLVNFLCKMHSAEDR